MSAEPVDRTSALRPIFPVFGKAAPFAPRHELSPSDYPAFHTCQGPSQSGRLPVSADSAPRRFDPGSRDSAPPMKGTYKIPPAPEFLAVCLTLQDTFPEHTVPFRFPMTR